MDINLQTGLSIIAAAVLVEATVNVIKAAKEKYRDWRYWLALASGILVALNYGLDFFELLGLDALVPYVGAIFTGLIISRGANFVADVFAKIQGREDSG